MASRMTAPHTTRARPSGEAAPESSVTTTGAAPLVVAVTAVVVTRGRTPFLPATLEALAAQDRAPDEVVVVDVGAAESTSRHPDLRLGEMRYVAAAGVRGLGEAVDRGIQAVGVPEDGWLWILHDDSAPEPDALARLLRAVEHSSAVGVAGCKQRRWDTVPDEVPDEAPDDVSGAAADRAPDGTGVLIEVGHTVSPLGRRMTGVDESEIDQGQHDGREDVLAVGLAGALVRGAVWTALGGTEPEVGPFGDGLDLCRRARLAGHRVVVVPDAVVRHAQASLLGRREEPDAPADVEASRYARRRSQLFLRLVWTSLPLLPVVWAAMLVWAPFAAMYRLALKRPAHARDELVAAAVTALRLVPLYRARRRAARTRRLPRRVLRPLRGTWREVAAGRRDARLSRAEAHRVRWAPGELERAELRRLARTRHAVLGAVLVAVVALDLVLFGPWQGVLADGGRIVGGALLPAPGTVGDVWEAATSGWVRDGLGARAAADPLWLPLAALAGLVGGGAQTGVNTLVLLALPLAALAGWAGTGALTRAVGVRAAGALAWAAAPAFLATLASGRLGALVVHLVLPWVLVAVLRAVGAHARDRVDVPGARTGRRRRGSLGAAGAAGLLLAVAVCAAPVLLPVAAVVLGAAAVLARRAWRRILLVLLPAVVLPLPYWVQVTGDWSAGGWRLLLAEPGGPVVAAGAPTGLELLLGLPGDVTWFGLDGDGAPGLLGRAGPALLGAVVLLLALVALARPTALRGVRLAWLGAAAGLATAVLAAATAVASGTTADGRDAPVTGWPGAGLSVLLLGLGAAAVLALPDRPLAGWHRHAGLRRLPAAGLAAVGVVALLLPAAQLASWTVGSTAGDHVGALRASGTPVVPAVGQQMQAPPRAASVLQIDRVEPGAPAGQEAGGDVAPVVDYTLLHADGSRLQDASSVVAARAAGLLPGDARDDVTLLDDLVADVATGPAADAAARLASLGVGAVQVPAGGDPELVTTLDLVPGLSRVTEGGTLVWRVTTDGPAPAWATVVRTSPDEAPDREPGTATGGELADAATFAPRDAGRTLDATGMRASGDVPDGAEERSLRIAAAHDGGWRATLDGRRLLGVDAGGTQAFVVGPEAGHLHVEYVSPHRTAWLVLAGGVLLVYALLALPVGRRRGR